MTAPKGRKVLDKIVEKSSDGGKFERPCSHPDPPQSDCHKEVQNSHTLAPSIRQTLRIEELPEPSTSKETERVSLPLTTPPSVPPFSFEDEIFRDFGKASRLPKEDRHFYRTSQPPYIFPHHIHQMKEDLFRLSDVINREWLEERRLDTKIIKFYLEPALILGHISDMLPQDILYDLRVGVNIIPKYVVDTYFPTQPRSKSNIVLKFNKRELLDNHGVIRVIPVTLRDKRMFLDFHVFDIPEGTMPFILVGLLIASLINATHPGKLQLQFGKEVLDIGMSRALNTKTESKPEVDPLEEVMGISLEKREDQPSLEEEASDFSAVDVSLKFEELGESLRPDPPRIEHK